MLIILACLFTFGIALLFTMIGLGGGLLYSPFLILYGVSLPLAVSTSLLINGLAGLSASIAYIQKGMVNFRVSMPLIAGSMAGAPFGAQLIGVLPAKLIVGILCLAMLFGAYRMVLSPAQADEDRSPTVGIVRVILAGGGLGFLIGILGSMLGIGGGIFMVPILIFVMRVSTRNAAATSTLISASLSGSGFVSHLALGNFQPQFTIPLGIAGIIGGQIGSRIMIQKISGKTIRRIFAALLVAMAMSLIYKMITG